MDYENLESEVGACHEQMIFDWFVVEVHLEKTINIGNKDDIKEQHLPFCGFRGTSGGRTTR